MVATYTSNLRLTKQGDNDNPNTWGDVVNNQVTSLIDEAIAGVTQIDVTGSSDINIATSTANGMSDVARHAVLELTGTLGANIQLIVPSVEKVYIIRAAYTGAFAITIIPAGGGSGIIFNTGDKSLIYTNGTSIYKIFQDGVLLAANNLSDLANITTARTNLGLGTSAVLDAGTGPNNVPQLDVNGNLPYIPGIVPTGAAVPFFGSSAPSGFLFCDGAAISRTTYAALFAAIGTAFGVGDGTTTFNVPDAKGRGLIGRDNMGGTPANRITTAGSGIDGTILGAAGGLQNHTLTVTELPPHKHFTLTNSNLTTNNNPTATTQANRASNGGLGNQDYIMQGSAIDATVGLSSSTGDATAFSVTQPSLIINWLIKT